MSIFEEVVSGDLRYGGFVYVDTSDSKPSFYHVNIASMMFDKKQLKQTRTLNPLFAQEHESTVELVSVGGILKVVSKEKQKQLLLEIPVKKLALVASVEKAMYAVVLRAKGDKYLCHRFQTKSSKAASDLTLSLNDLIANAASIPDMPVFGDNDDDNNNNYDDDIVNDDDNEQQQEDQERPIEYADVAAEEEEDSGFPMMRMLSKKNRSQSAEEDNNGGLPLMRMLSKKNRKGNEPIVDNSSFPEMNSVREALYEDLPEPSDGPRNESDGGYLEPMKILGRQPSKKIEEDIYSEPPSNSIPNRSNSASIMFRSGVPLNPAPPPRSGPPRTNTASMSRPRMQPPSSSPRSAVDTFRTADYYFDSVSRRESESRLRGQPPGTFMIRLAESHQGYALTMTLFDGSIQHFKVWQDEDAKFRIAGNEGRGFSTLTDLVEHYRWSPITNSGDFCVRACPRLASDPHVYEATLAE